MTQPITDLEARKALAFAYALARRQWFREGQRLDLSEYEDTALTALVGCLERYQAGGKSFSSYVWRCVRPRLRDTAEHYRLWHVIQPREAGIRPHAWCVRPEGSPTPETHRAQADE